MKRIPFWGNKGVALVAVIVFTLILLVLGATFLQLATSERILTDKNVYLAQVFYLAEAGIERRIAYLKSLDSPPTGTEPLDTLEGELPGIGTYEADVYPDEGNPNSAIKRYKIVSTGMIDNPVITVTKSITLEVSTESFAKYSYFTNQEVHPIYGTIWFFTNDNLDGPVHSNSQIHIYGAPIFQDIVTSTADSFYYYPGVPCNPHFHKGYRLGVDYVDMNKLANLQRLENLAAGAGLKLNSDYKIEMNSDGTLTYQKKLDGGSWDSPTTCDIPANGVVYVDGTAIVSGTLDGRLTLVAENDIEIPDHIQYSTPPTSPHCDDMLGLVAGRSIKVTKSSPPHANLEINGVLMCFDQSFEVENFRHIPVMGQIRVWGGIIQNYRGPVGTFNSQTGQQISGFLKNYHYDTRVIDNPPPHFPTTGRYERDSWQEQPAVWE